MSREPKRTGAPPRVVNNVVFRCYKVGIMTYEWRSEDGELVVLSNHRRSTFTAIYKGGVIGRLYRSQEKAMEAAIERRAANK